MPENNTETNQKLGPAKGIPGDAEGRETKQLRLASPQTSANIDDKNSHGEVVPFVRLGVGPLWGFEAVDLDGALSVCE